MVSASSADLQTVIPSQIYACYIPASAYLVKIGGGTYDRADYRARPDEYRSVFASKVSCMRHTPRDQQLTDRLPHI